MTRVVAPGLDEKLTEPRPEPSDDEKKDVRDKKKEACQCGIYPRWYCDSWPRCVSI